MAEPPHPTPPPPTVADEVALLRRRLDRERTARKAAESALEAKAAELYDASERLRSANAALTGEVAEQATARRASEARAAAVVDAAFDAVLAVDAAGTVVSWNRQAERTFGHPAAAAVGRPVADLVVPPADRPAFDRMATVVRRGRRSGRSWEADAVDAAGRRFPVEVAVTVVPSSAGLTYAAFVRDITLRRQAERRRAALYEVARLLAGDGDVTGTLGEVLRVLAVGLGCDAGFAWQVDAAAGLMRLAAEWTAGPAQGPMLAATRGRTFVSGHGLPGRVWAGGQPRCIGRLIEDGNFPRRFAAEAAGLRSGVAVPVLVDGATFGVLEFFHAEAGEADADLVSVVAAAGGQVAQFVRRRLAEADAARATATAVAASRAKSDFLANMSHEIRTPLNGVVGMLELLGGTPLDATQRRHATVARASAGTLLTLINDILDFSKIEAGQLALDPVPFDLVDVAAEAVGILSAKAEAKRLRLAMNVDPVVDRRRVGAADRVRQVLVNLLGNAVKFTAAGSVSLSVTADADGAVRFAVTDTGIGIPPDRLDRLFKSFSQVDASTTRQYGGTGLGLAISKQLATLMGGAVGVTSTVGQGSTFWFTAALPVDATPPAIAPPPMAAGPVAIGPGRRVLVAEDNEVNQVVIGELLRRLGCRAELVDNGHAAVLAVAGGGYDLVLMDCQMPTLDGFDATAAIRRAEANGGRPRLPVVALTANAIKGDRERCLAAGMDDYLTKPIDAALLAAKLAQWLPAAVPVASAA